MATQADIEKLVRQSVLNEVWAMILYTRLANRVESPDAQRLLRMLAAAEEGHVNRLTELVGVLGVEGAGALGSIAVVMALRDEGAERYQQQLNDAGMSDNSTVNELLTFAVATEERAGGHYQTLAEQASDARVRDFFQALVEEEADHARQLESLRMMLKASGSRQ